MVEEKKTEPPAQIPAKRPRTWVLILVNLLILILVFGGLEAAVRVIQSRRLGPNASHQPALRDRFRAWRNNPAFGRVDILHNSAGFRRDRELSLEKPPGTVRIFLLGGSAAYGSEGLYPEVDNRFTRLYNHQLMDHYLEEKLNAELPGRKWEVINAAVNEYRMHQSLAALTAVLMPYRPDLILNFDGHNDISGFLNATEVYNPYQSTPHGGEFEALSNPQSFSDWILSNTTWLRNNSQFFLFLQNQLRFRFQRGRRSRTAGESRRFSDPVQFSELTAEEQRAAQRAISHADYYTLAARRIHRVAQLEGVRSIFLLQPQLVFSHKPFTDSEKRLYEYHRKVSGPLFLYVYEQLYPEISRRMTAAAAQDGFEFLDMTDAFDSSSEQTFTDYCHMTPAGNRLIAERVFTRFRPLFEKLAEPGNSPTR
jgi:lysophospholipase L1-like esterase